MRLVQATADALLIEVGVEQHLTGRFVLDTSDRGKSALSFVNGNGDTLSCSHDRVGATVGRSVEVVAYPVQPSPSITKSPGQSYWIVCPCSSADIWDWGNRFDTTLPQDLFADAESGKLRRRQTSAKQSVIIRQ